MRASFSELLNEVQNLSPALAKKDWGFTVAEDGGLLVFDPGEALTEDETAYLTNLLNSNDQLVQLSNKLSESLIDGIALERGPSGSSRYLGQYHVDKSNLKDIIDVRGIIDAPQIHQRVNRASTTADPFSIFTEMTKQLSSRAEARYAPLDWQPNMTTEQNNKYMLSLGYERVDTLWGQNK